jgi:hypothetical protein
MSEEKYYEEGSFDFAFVPEGGPFEGRLVTRFPEVPPYVANINLLSPRSRNTYAGEAAEYCAVDESELKGALIGVCALRSEEVAAAAQEAEQAGSDAEEELPEVSQEEIDERVGRPGVLARFAEAAAACSRVIGDRKHLELVALGASSAQLDPLPNGRPLGANVIVTAPPGRGKNYLADAVARLLPEDFCLPFESASSKSLYYAVAENPALLRNRWVYPNEAEATDLLVETLRPLLSGGLARHLTINKDASGRNVGQELTIEGPITVTIPTIRNKLDNQLQSRMLVAGLEDYEGRVGAHSGAVSEQLSPEYAGTDHADEIRAWQAALGSLTGIRRVVVPTDDERFRFDSDDVPHGARLWANLLALMATHAWLEQRNREVIDLAGGGKAVVATAEDYEAAYHIFEATCERSVRNLSKTHRKILDGMYRLQKGLEDRSDWHSWSGLSQRKIAQAAGVSQSTVSENKTFLFKSAKLVREAGEGGLALVKDAEPSWWDTGDALLGFPKPEAVRSWWGGDDPTPPSPEGTDHADHEGDTALKAASEAVNGDRRDADQSLETDDHSEKKSMAQGDRQDGTGDRKVADRENGLLKANDPSEEEVIGVIGDSLSDDLSSESIANSADHGGEPEGRPTPVTNRDSSDGEERSGTEDVNATAGEESQERLAKVEGALRHYGIDHRAEAVYYNLPRLQRDGVFDDIGFVPTDREVKSAQRTVLAGWTLPKEVFEKGPSSWPPNLPPPIEDGGAIHCDLPLHRVWKSPFHKNERDPEALRDAVAADYYVFFVPTVEEIVRAMRMSGVEPEFSSDRQTAAPPEVSPSIGPSEEPISELERALRSPQRAPRPVWPGNDGSPNKLQQWIQAKGGNYVHDSWRPAFRRPAIREVISELLTKGYLETKPPEKEVREVLAKMVREKDEAEDRHHERVWRGRR